MNLAKETMSSEAPAQLKLYLLHFVFGGCVSAASHLVTFVLQFPVGLKNINYILVLSSMRIVS